MRDLSGRDRRRRICLQMIMTEDAKETDMSFVLLLFGAMHIRRQKGCFYKIDLK